METNRGLYLGLVVVLLVVDFSVAELKGNVNGNTSLDPQVNDTKSSDGKGSGSNSVSNTNELDKTKKNEGDQVNKSMENIGDDMNKNNLGTQSGTKKPDNVERGDGGLSQGSQAKKSDDNKKEDSSGGIENSKEVPQEMGSHVENCDLSNKCTDEENKFVACLRVPGNDSPDLLSLLIQNKGKGNLSITISAPDFVQLEKKEVKLEGKQNGKVKVSISKRGNDSSIVLKAGNGRCNLDISDLVAHYFGKESENSHKSTYINITSRTPIVVVVSFAALLTLVLGLMCVSFRKRQVLNNVSKYQRLDAELPVSGRVKIESEDNDGWNNNWGDDWDDEEAPKTPPVPVTPSVSSKGLAARRLNKEGWKD